MTEPIAICLATCNGARFLPEQLDSIAAQTCRDWHLYARDDGSEDGTSEILDDFALTYPGRVSLIRDARGRLGARANFARLMEIAREPYIAFSDQDDVWRPDKLARARARLRALEAAHPPGTPAMVHADRRVIDAAGAEITPSYWASRGLTPADFPRLETHYTFCLAAGSTMLINRPLCDLALPVPEAARMHDTWIELVAHAFGAVAWLDGVALDYRRHGGNASGPVRDNNSAAARRPLARAARLLAGLDGQRRAYGGFLDQAAAFRERFEDRLDPVARARLDRFLAISGQGLLGRILALIRSRATPPGPARALVFVALSGGIVPELQDSGHRVPLSWTRKAA